MIAVLLALLSSCLWGASDFLGDAGGVAGVAGLLGLLAFYAAFASGPMGPLAAIVAATQALVPVGVAVLWRAEALSQLAWIGIAVALVGSLLIGLAESSASGRTTLRPIAFAVLAGIFFGTTVASLGLAPQDSGQLAPAVEMVIGLGLVGVLVLAAHRSTRADAVMRSIGITSGERRPPRRTDLIAITGGVVLAAATIAEILALQDGSLAAVGVVISLYPITTALLARIFLHERLTPLHLIGIAAALGGTALLALS